MGRHVLRVQAVGATGRRSGIRTHVVVIVAPALLLSFPGQLAAEPGGTLLVVESGGRILRVNPATGESSVVTAVARPFGLARAPSGAVYFTDGGALRRIDAAGAISTVAEFLSDVGPLAVDRDENVFVTTVGRIYRLRGGVPPAEPYAGTGVEGGGGDGGPALEAQLRRPHGLALAADGALLIGDSGNDRVRRVDPSTRMISSVASVRIPSGVAVGPDGLIYVASSGQDAVVRIEAAGSVTTFATGIESASSLTFGAEGTLYVTEGGLARARIWRVVRDGSKTPIPRPASS